MVLGNHPTNIGGTNYGGEWLQIKFPVSITLLNYMIYGRIYGGYNPTYWKLVGCNTGLGRAALKDASELCFFARATQ